MNDSSVNTKTEATDLSSKKGKPNEIDKFHRTDEMINTKFEVKEGKRSGLQIVNEFNGNEIKFILLIGDFSELKEKEKEAEEDGKKTYNFVSNEIGTNKVCEIPQCERNAKGRNCSRLCSVKDCRII